MLFDPSEVVDAGPLTTEEFWAARWQHPEAIYGLPFADEIIGLLPGGNGATSFCEVGCFPGGILADLSARMGYVAYGIDLVGNPADVAALLEAKGVRVGEIHKADFLSWNPNQRYDVVGSFGFVEHFADAARVVDRHFALARPGGYVIIGVPNYARGQWLLHRLFDAAILEGHNFGVMSLPFFTDAAKRNGAELLTARYVGGQFAFWMADKTPRSWIVERIMWRTLWVLKRLMRLLPEGTNRWFSPYLYAVYRKGI